VAASASDQRAPRRRWPLSEKQRIVELTLREGTSIRAIAREEGVHPTSLCHWRAEYRAGKLGASAKMQRTGTRSATPQLLPVTIAPPSSSSPDARNVVELRFSSGASLRIESVALEAPFVCALVAQLQQ